MKSIRINLASFSEALSRTEMKAIVAGWSGSCPITCSGTKICDSANGCHCNSNSDTCHEPTTFV